MRRKFSLFGILTNIIISIVLAEAVYNRSNLHDFCESKNRGRGIKGDPFPVITSGLHVELLHIRDHIRTATVEAKRLANVNLLTSYAVEKFLLDCDDVEREHLQQTDEILKTIKNGSSMEGCESAVTSLKALLGTFHEKLHCGMANVFVFPATESLPFDASAVSKECLTFRLSQTSTDSLDVSDMSSRKKTESVYQQAARKYEKNMCREILDDLNKNSKSTPEAVRRMFSAEQLRLNREYQVSSEPIAEAEQTRFLNALNKDPLQNKNYSLECQKVKNSFSSSRRALEDALGKSISDNLAKLQPEKRKLFNDQEIVRMNGADFPADLKRIIHNRSSSDALTKPFSDWYSEGMKKRTNNSPNSRQTIKIIAINNFKRIVLLDLPFEGSDLRDRIPRSVRTAVKALILFAFLSIEKQLGEFFDAGISPEVQKALDDHFAPRFRELVQLNKSVRQAIFEKFTKAFTYVAPVFEDMIGKNFIDGKPVEENKKELLDAIEMALTHFKVINKPQHYIPFQVFVLWTVESFTDEISKWSKESVEKMPSDVEKVEAHSALLRSLNEHFERVLLMLEYVNESLNSHLSLPCEVVKAVPAGPTAPNATKQIIKDQVRGGIEMRVVHLHKELMAALRANVAEFLFVKSAYEMRARVTALMHHTIHRFFKYLRGLMTRFIEDSMSPSEMYPVCLKIFYGMDAKIAAEMKSMTDVLATQSVFVPAGVIEVFSFNGRSRDELLNIFFSLKKAKYEENLWNKFDVAKEVIEKEVPKVQKRNEIPVAVAATYKDSTAERVERGKRHIAKRLSTIRSNRADKNAKLIAVYEQEGKDLMKSLRRDFIFLDDYKSLSYELYWMMADESSWTRVEVNLDDAKAGPNTRKDVKTAPTANLPAKNASTEAEKPKKLVIPSKDPKKLMKDIHSALLPYNQRFEILIFDLATEASRDIVDDIQRLKFRTLASEYAESRLTAIKSMQLHAFDYFINHYEWKTNDQLGLDYFSTANTNDEVISFVYRSTMVAQRYSMFTEESLLRLEKDFARLARMMLDFDADASDVFVSPVLIAQPQSTRTPNIEYVRQEMYQALIKAGELAEQFAKYKFLMPHCENLMDNDEDFKSELSKYSKMNRMYFYVTSSMIKQKGPDQLFLYVDSINKHLGQLNDHISKEIDDCLNI